jgi:hypothetical protein
MSYRHKKPETLFSMFPVNVENTGVEPVASFLMNVGKASALAKGVKTKNRLAAI